MFYLNLQKLLVLCVNQHNTMRHGLIWVAVPVCLQSNSQTHTYKYSCSIWIWFNHIQFIMTLLSRLQPLGWVCGFNSWRHDCARKMSLYQMLSNIKLKFEDSRCHCFVFIALIFLSINLRENIEQLPLWRHYLYQERSIFKWILRTKIISRIDIHIHVLIFHLKC